jgi:predicted metal-dependent HD superfamily phosphohydrolase
MPTLPDERMRCPTCGADQEWADSCRRCRCDLRLLRAARAAYSSHRRECLSSLENGWIENARYHAQRSHQLLPHAGSYRLLAICHLMSERWPEAIRDARRATAEPGALAD